MQKRSIIAAIGEDNELGKDNKLIWDLPADHEHFRKVTDGRPFIMGRVSYESEDMLYSEGWNIVLTGKILKNLSPNFEVAHSINEALRLLKEEAEIFILGGAKVFDQMLPLANYMYLTIVHHQFDADAWFPEVNWEEWEQVSSFFHEKDERHQFAFSIQEYKRRS